MSPEPSRRSAAIEALAVFGATFVGSAGLGLLGFAIPFVRVNLLAFVAALFLYLPLAVLRRRGADPVDFGLTSAGWPRALLAALLVMLAVFPPFVGAYHVYHGELGSAEPSLELRRLERWEPALTGRPDGLDDSSAWHLWADGDELVVAGGKAATTPTTTLTVSGNGPCERAHGDILGGSCEDGRLKCRVGPSRGCRILAPGWHALRVTATQGSGELLLARHRQPAELPVEADRGLTWWWTFVLVHLLLVALPEEVLYRGYLQTRLDSVFKRRWRLLGANVGWSVVVTSALFALGHLAIEPGPERLAVFFPSLLFGWLRARTGTVVAPIAVHAASNVLLQVVSSFYYY